MNIVTTSIAAASLFAAAALGQAARGTLSGAAMDELTEFRAHSIDASRLSDEDKRKWQQVVELATRKGPDGNYANPMLHGAYERLDTGARTFLIVNEDLGKGTAGKFTITKFSGPDDFSEATLALNFRTIKDVQAPTRGDFDRSFRKFEGLLGKNGFVLRLAETFGHEANHAIFAMDKPREAVRLQRQLNERDGALLALPRGKGRYPFAPDTLRKMQAPEEALMATERYAQAAEKAICGELQAKQTGIGTGGSLPVLAAIHARTAARH